MDKNNKPIGVRIIFLYSLFASAIITISNVIHIDDKFHIVRGAQHSFWENVSILDYLFSSVTNVALYLAAAITLFNLKRPAFQLFVSCLILSISSAAYHFYNGSSQTTNNPISLIGMITNWVVLAIILFYVHQLMKKGLLK